MTPRRLPIPNDSRHDQRPITLHSLEEAEKRLGAHLAEQPEEYRRIIAIGGAVGSGKSTLAARLLSAWGASIISTDDYLPNYDEIPDHQRDEPEASDLSALRTHLDLLRDTGEAEVPEWSFQTHRRIGTRRVIASGPIICEGIFALHPTIAPAVDLRVLVRADRTIRWNRWEMIEKEGERGWGVEKARAHFETIAEPTYAKHAHLYETALDYIVLNDTLR